MTDEQRRFIAQFLLKTYMSKHEQLRKAEAEARRKAFRLIKGGLDEQRDDDSKPAK